jgi:hypothetical protein
VTGGPPRTLGCVFLVLLLLAVASPLAARQSPKPKSLSTDGEATIYLTGDFSTGFSVAYNAILPAALGNRSRTFVGIMLIGRTNPGPRIELGLTRGDPNAAALQAFTSVNSRNGGHRFQSIPVRCTPACRLVLRGDKVRLRALIVTQNAIQEVGSWARSDFGFLRPYVQLNGEVSERGDTIAAVLVPMRVVAASQSLPAPTCGFTTRGIQPRRLAGGTLTFTGTYRDAAPTSFVDLRSGRLVGRCTP